MRAREAGRGGVRRDDVASSIDAALMNYDYICEPRCDVACLSSGNSTSQGKARQGCNAAASAARAAAALLTATAAVSVAVRPAMLRNICAGSAVSSMAMTCCDCVEFT